MSCLTGTFELLSTHQHLFFPASSPKAKADVPGLGQNKPSMKGQ
jgi:hypothetical protein